MRNLSRIVVLVLVLALVGCTPELATEERASPLPSELPVGLSSDLPTDVPIAVPTAEFSVTSPTVTRIVAGLEGLSFDEFIEASYREHLLRRPESITRLGLAESLGQRNDRLNDLSDAYLRETQELEGAILALLWAYDREALDLEQQISYDVYEWYLEDLVRGHEFTYHNYPLHHFLGSYHDQLIRLLTEIHPITDKQDAEDYVARLSQVDTQVQQLLEGLRIR